MNRFFIAAFPFLMIWACRSAQPDTVNGDSARTDTAKKNYLPVADYLKSEIAGVDSFPFRLMRYHFQNDRTDSGIITTAQFDKIAAEFLQSGLDSSHFEKSFEENSFVDRSTNLISFTYSTKDTGYGLKRVDVLISPGTGINKLNSIYMEAISGNSDSTVISKLTWNAGRNFRILHIQKPKIGPETASQTVVVWDSRE
jgi:hypothetical protein